MVEPTFKTGRFWLRKFSSLPLSSLLVSIYYSCMSSYIFSRWCFMFGEFQVFPKGFPLVADVSGSVLNVKEIEDAWFGTQSSCPYSSTSVSTNSLSLKCFWGLFLITGIVSFLALMIFLANFVYEHRTLLLQSSNSEASTQSRILDLLKIFFPKDLKSHTFGRSRSEPDADRS